MRSLFAALAVTAVLAAPAGAQATQDPADFVTCVKDRTSQALRNIVQGTPQPAPLDCRPDATGATCLVKQIGEALGGNSVHPCARTRSAGAADPGCYVDAVLDFVRATVEGRPWLPRAC